MVVDWRTLPSEWWDLPGGTSGISGSAAARLMKALFLPG